MNAPIDTLAFAERFDAGFGHEQARALATALSQAQEAGRGDLVTTSYLDARLADFRAELLQALADQNLALTRAIADQNLALRKAIAENGKDISNRLWSTVTIIAGVATAISATVAVATALLLKAGGI